MKLRKSKDNVLLTGLLGGLGEYYKLDPTFIRIGFALLSFLGAFPMIPLYIIAAILIPEADSTKDQSDKNNLERKKIDKSSIDKHNVDSLSETNEIEEDDWSDF